MARDDTLVTQLLVDVAKLYGLEGVSYEMQLNRCQQSLAKLTKPAEGPALGLTDLQIVGAQSSYRVGIQVHDEMMASGIKDRQDRYRFLTEKGIPPAFAKCLVVDDFKYGKIRLYTDTVEFDPNRSIVEFRLMQPFSCHYRPDKIGKATTFYLRDRKSVV